MDIANLIQEMYIPVVVVACLLFGFIVKKWIKDIDNKWIPTIVAVLGAILACWVNGKVDLNTIVAGCASGLGSTGLHQVYKQLISGNNVEEINE